MFRIFLLCCLMLTGIQNAVAGPVPTAQEEDNQAPASEPVSEDILPDAMQHVPKAPNIDFANLRDPFASYLSLIAKRGKAILEEQIKLLGNREREELENYDLSTLRLVGIYTMGEDRVAMIQDPAGKGYTVRRGNYMGKNNGQIEKIDSDTLYLVEKVVNPAGEVVDNQVTLTLKEVNK